MLRSFVGPAGLLLFVVVSACGGEAAVDASVDAAAGRDAAPVDATSEDAAASEEDAASEDAASEDAAAERDAAGDAGRGCDGGSPTEICNRFDDDCDGAVDERACGTCSAAIAPSGLVYLFCPSRSNATAAWADGCEERRGGYRLASLTDESDQIWASSELARRELHGAWVGIRKSPSMGGPFLDREGAERTIESVDPSLADDNCVARGLDGWSDRSCLGAFADVDSFLCSGPLATTRPVPCGVETCDQTDDDCDGLVDEAGACPACETFHFIGHTYYLCEPGVDVDFAAARDACTAFGTSLASIESADENDAVATRSGGFPYAWLGGQLVDDTWRWLDGRPIPTMASEGYANWERSAPPELDPGLCMERNTDAFTSWGTWACNFVEPAYLCETTPTAGP